MFRYFVTFLLLLIPIGAQELELKGIASQEIKSGDLKPVEKNGTDFGIVQVGQKKTEFFTIRNSGGQGLKLDTPQAIDGDSNDFEIVFESGEAIEEVLPGGTVRFAITFRPLQRNESIATIAIGDPGLFTFAVGGEGRGGAQIAVSGAPSSQADFISITNGQSPTEENGTLFPPVVIGSRLFHIFQIRSIGDLPLTQNVEFAGEGFTFINRNFDPEPGLIAEFGIRFEPENGGEHTGTVTITTNDPNNPSFIFTVAGFGNDSPGFSIEGSGSSNFFRDIDNESSPIIINGTIFATQPDEPLTNVFKISNNRLNGEDGLGLIYSAEIDQPFFEILGLEGQLLESDDDDEFEIRYIGGQDGPVSAVITFTTNDPDNETFSLIIETQEPFADLSLTGVPPGLSRFDNSLPILAGSTTPEEANGTDLGQVILGSGETRFSITMENSGTIPLEVTNVEVMPGVSSDAFRVIPRPLSISAGFSRNFDLFFEPENLGINTAVIRITSNSATTPVFTFTVQAEAYVPDEAILAIFTSDGRRLFPSFLQLLNRTLVFGDALAQDTITLRNLGMAPVTGITLDEVSAGLSISGVPTTLAGTSQATVVVELDVSENNGSFQIQSDDLEGEFFELNYSPGRFEEPVEVSEITLLPDGLVELKVDKIISGFVPVIEVSRDLREWNEVEILNFPFPYNGSFQVIITQPSGSAPVFFRSSAEFTLQAF